MHGRLDSTQVASAQPAVQPAHPFRPDNLANAVKAVPVLSGSGDAARPRPCLVELQSRLDQPDGVGEGRGCKPGRNGSLCMYYGIVLGAAEQLRSEMPEAVYLPYSV